MNHSVNSVKHHAGKSQLSFFCCNYFVRLNLFFKLSVLAMQRNLNILRIFSVILDAMKNIGLELVTDPSDRSDMLSLYLPRLPLVFVLSGISNKILHAVRLLFSILVAMYYFKH